MHFAEVRFAEVRVAEVRIAEVHVTKVQTSLIKWHIEKDNDRGPETISCEPVA